MVFIDDSLPALETRQFTRRNFSPWLNSQKRLWGRVSGGCNLPEDLNFNGFSQPPSVCGKLRSAKRETQSSSDLRDCKIGYWNRPLDSWRLWRTFRRTRRKQANAGNKGGEAGKGGRAPGITTRFAGLRD